MRLRGLLIAAALIVFASWLLPPFYVTLANYVGLASIVVLGLVLLGGAGGLMSFGQAAFVGVAAYTTAYLTLAHGFSPWLTLPLGLVLTGVLAFLLGALTLRLTGHYLPIGTLAWGISLYYVFANVPAWGKHDGLADIPGLSVLGYTLNSGHGFFYLIWGVVALAVLSIENILDSRFGRAVRSGGRTTPMAEAFGINTARVSMAIFVYAALLAAMSGWLYAHFLRFVNPTPFGLSTSIEYFFMAVIGGASSTWGAIAGAVFYIVGKQWLQTLISAVTGRVGQLDIIVFGLVIIGAMVATGSMALTAPTACPAPQIFFHGLAVSVLVKSTVRSDLSCSGVKPAAFRLGSIQFAVMPVTAALVTISSMRTATVMSLRSASPRLSAAAMKRVPMYARSAPRTCAATILDALPIPPERTIGPSQKARTSAMNAKLL
jgi:ABC-type branched-subunit amino acid transport system permease subunit